MFSKLFKNNSKEIKEKILIKLDLLRKLAFDNSKDDLMKSLSSIKKLITEDSNSKVNLEKQSVILRKINILNSSMKQMPESQSIEIADSILTIYQTKNYVRSEYEKGIDSINDDLIRLEKKLYITADAIEKVNSEMEKSIETGNKTKYTVNKNKKKTYEVQYAQNEKIHGLVAQKLSALEIAKETSEMKEILDSIKALNLNKYISDIEKNVDSIETHSAEINQDYNKVLDKVDASNSADSSDDFEKAREEYLLNQKSDSPDDVSSFKNKTEE